jgi:hypothetical protein
MKKAVLIFAMVMAVCAINAQTRTSIKLSQLPKAITENLASQHQGWIAQEAFKIDTKNVITYEVIAKKDQSEMNLVYDKDGKYMKMEPHHMAAVTPSKSTSSATQASASKPASSATKPNPSSQGKK